MANIIYLQIIDLFKWLFIFYTKISFYIFWKKIFFYRIWILRYFKIHFIQLSIYLPFHYCLSD